MAAKMTLRISLSCKFCIIFLLQGVAFTGVAFAQTSSTAAQAIIQKMGDAYNKLESYQDNGTIENKIYDKPKQINDSSVKFSTFFKRPKYQRVEWDGGASGGISGAPGRWLLLNDGKESCLYSISSNEYVRSTDYSSIMNNAIGVADGSIFTTSWIFFSHDIKLTDVGTLENLQQLPDENLDGFTCHIITGIDVFSNAEYKLWIDSDSYLLRRSEHFIKSVHKLARPILEKYYKDAESFPETDLDASLLVSESHHDIKVNPSLPDNLFTFIPPANSIRKEKLSIRDGKPILFPIISKLFNLKASKTIYLLLIFVIILAILPFFIYRIFIRRGEVKDGLSD